MLDIPLMNGCNICRSNNRLKTVPSIGSPPVLGQRSKVGVLPKVTGKY